MNRRFFSIIALLVIPDVVLAAYLLVLLHTERDAFGVFITTVLPVVGALLLIKVAVLVTLGKYFYLDRIGFIKRVIAEFKKGKYYMPRFSLRGRDELAGVFRDLTVIGKHFEDVVSTQKSEIEQLREMYNNIVLSMSSYFLVLDEDEDVLFANESFCRKFQYQQDEIYGKNIEEVFYFLTGRVREAIGTLKNTGESVVMEKTHLLSKRRISVIADIKISRMVVQGRNQIILVIDDITNRCRKDYQITLLSQISESIRRDEELDEVLFTILTGVTSGSGLGFNRAMLFLVDEKESSLVGRMAVGPDSIEEAIEIWSSMPSGKIDLIDQFKGFTSEQRKGRKLLDRVISSRFPFDHGSVLTAAMENVESIHVYDADGDGRIDEGLRALMDVREFVVVPLVAVNRAIGVIVADNKFNQVPITGDSIELLSIFGFQAALSIESYNNLAALKKEMQKITDRQEAIVETEKLAAVGRIAAHIAHEIRNPLVTMGGYARRVLQLGRDASKHESMIRSAASVILKESERLEKVLSNVMDFTRPSPYIQEFNSVNDVINDTIDLLRNLFQERRIEVRLKLAKDTPLVKSDFNQMKQLMLNLVQNAIDATPPEGAIEIVTETDAKSVIIYVRDSGSGIREDELGRVFEPFYTTKVTGVGLGLAIVKRIVNDHNGEISVRNLPHGGTEFRVVLNIPGE